MPPLNDDSDLDALVAELQKRQALRTDFAALGPADPDFNRKAFSDALWGDCRPTLYQNGRFDGSASGPFLSGLKG